MKKVTVLLLALLASSAMAQVHVNGYVKKDGAYVAPTVRSAPNNTQADNYSTKGNTNPYNGNAGTNNPEPDQYSPPPVRQAPNTQSGYAPMKPMKIKPNGF